MSRSEEFVRPADASAEVHEVAFDERGLVPVVAQEARSGEVLMLAWANREALRLTLETGWAHYYSRSRGELWRKGATSGHTQRALEVRTDCDGDTLLYLVAQQGPACHTGRASCFFRRLPASAQPEVAAADPGPAAPGRAFDLLERVVAQRLAEQPEGSYVTKLHRRGLGYVAQKVVEEAGETVVAALQGKSDELRAEAADLLFHLTVLLHESGLGLAEVERVLEERHRSRGQA